MRRYRVTGVIPGEDRTARERAEACAAYAAERGLKLVLAAAETLLDPDETEAPDGFLLFLSEETCSCVKEKLIRSLRARYPDTEIRCLYPRSDEKETAATYLAYWPSRSAVDQLRRRALSEQRAEEMKTSKDGNV